MERGDDRNVPAFFYSERLVWLPEALPESYLSTKNE